MAARLERLSKPRHVTEAHKNAQSAADGASAAASGAGAANKPAFRVWPNTKSRNKNMPRVDRSLPKAPNVLSSTASVGRGAGGRGASVGDGEFEFGEQLDVEYVEEEGFEEG